MARCEVRDGDREEVARFIERHWNSRIVMSGGKAFQPHLEEGFLERRGTEIVGLLTYHIDERGMEILTLNSTLEGQGIGSSLMLSAIDRARERECEKIWITTTNDRLRVIDFHQRVGFRMMRINLGVVDEARAIKPQIPLVGERGVPIHDEIVLELEIEPYLDTPGSDGNDFV
jgi:N-acetylglutamate synthase-like GNAT family acetyltransferase